MPTQDLLLKNDYVDPNTITAAWLNAIADYLEGLASFVSVSIAGSTTPVALSEAQYRNGRIKLTGVITANIAVELPTGQRRSWVIWNATTGSFTVTVKTAAGAGYEVRQGKRALVMADGTDILASVTDRLSADADDTIADGVDYALGSGAGTKWGTAASQKQAWWNTAPIVQPAGAGQAAVTAPAAFTNTNGAIGGLTIGAAYSQAEVQALRDAVEVLADDCRALRDKVATYETLLTALRTALVNAGLVKGAA